MEQKVQSILERHIDDKDLTGEEIESGLDWSNANLEEFNLMNQVFSTYESQANFKNTIMALATLSGSRFSHANLENAELQGTSLQGSNTEFVGANLIGATLAAADVNGAKLKYANLKNAYLSQANCIGTDFSNAKLEGADLWKADLRGANLFEADLRDSNLDETDFDFSNLYRARFYGTNIELAKLPKNDVNEIKINQIKDFKNKLMEKGIQVEIINEIIDNLYLINHDENRYKKASNIYNTVRNIFHLNGLYSEESHYHYKERNAFNKHLKIKKQYGQFFFNWLFKIISGYGEKWYFVLAWIIGFILFFGTLYLLLGGPIGKVANPVLDSYYFSGVTFTTLGFGDLFPGSNSFIMRIAAMIEAIIGAVLMALFVVVISKKIMS